MTNNEKRKSGNMSSETAEIDLSVLTKEVEAKLNVMSLLHDEAKLGLQRNRRRELQRHLNHIENHLDDLYKLKDQI